MPCSEPRNIFIAGGTGYMGRKLVPELLGRGHTVRALARSESHHKVPAGCTAVIGNALDSSTYHDQIAPADTFLHLVGVAHPCPAKAAQFRSLDLVAAHEAIRAARSSRIKHFVYVSVARPAPIMKTYQAVRAECENMIRETGLNTTILRPWYVLGPGHWWPYTLVPVYWLLERLPARAESAHRLGLVSLSQMTRALVRAIENPAQAYASGMFQPFAIFRHRPLPSKLDKREQRIWRAFRTKVMQNYHSACNADIYSPTCLDEMVSLPHGSVQHA